MTDTEREVHGKLMRIGRADWDWAVKEAQRRGMPRVGEISLTEWLREIQSQVAAAALSTEQEPSIDGESVDALKPPSSQMESAHGTSAGSPTPVVEGKDYIIFHCPVDKSIVVSIHRDGDPSDLYVGVAEVPDMKTARAIIEAMRQRSKGLEERRTTAPAQSESLPHENRCWACERRSDEPHSHDCEAEAGLYAQSESPQYGEPELAGCESCGTGAPHFVCPECGGPFPARPQDTALRDAFFAGVDAGTSDFGHGYLGTEEREKHYQRWIRTALRIATGGTE